MTCPKCGEDVYRIKGLHHDREQMRDDCWCEDCKTMFSCHAHGLEKRLVLKDVYRGEARIRIKNLLLQALDEIGTE
jgi:hypothetical protein